MTARGIEDTLKPAMDVWKMIGCILNFQSWILQFTVERLTVYDTKAPGILTSENTRSKRKLLVTCSSLLTSKNCCTLSILKDNLVFNGSNTYTGV